MTGARRHDLAGTKRNAEVAKFIDEPCQCYQGIAEYISAMADISLPA